VSDELLDTEAWFAKAIAEAQQGEPWSPSPIRILCRFGSEWWWGTFDFITSSLKWERAHRSDADFAQYEQTAETIQDKIARLEKDEADG
jgi:hypothetical protein